MHSTRILIAGFSVALIASCSKPADNAAAADSAKVAAPAAPADSTAGAASATGMVDPNAATKEQLTAIPGVTPAIADSLTAKRPFADMLAVDGVLSPLLSEADRDKVYAVLWKPIDLNTAPATEIKLIPGVGDKIAHEFEEYRPYKDIERFRREIGKYVDKNEVARLEKYVTIK
jgi:DNA uptake protein ComE-like DNA-binding protein